MWRLRLGRGWRQWKRTRDRGGEGGLRGKTAENRRARRERRYGRRREHRAGRGGGPSGGRFGDEGGCDGVDAHDGFTWNLERVSLREQNRGRLRRVAEWVEQRGWEVVLVTELFGEGEGVIWMGENEHRTDLVHGREAGCC